MRDTVQTLLANDAGVAAVLTGGVYAAREILREHPDTEGAFDANGEIRPCGLVKLTFDDTLPPADILGALALDIFLYERDSYINIDAALPLIRALLHEQKIGSSADKVFQVLHRNDIRDQEDSALRCNLHVSQFEIMRNRS